MSVNTPVTLVNIPQTIDLAKVKEAQRLLGRYKYVKHGHRQRQKQNTRHPCDEDYRERKRQTALFSIPQ